MNENVTYFDMGVVCDVALGCGPGWMHRLDVHRRLQRDAPPMEGVEGWLFFKASGGHGRRKLLAIPPDVDGYTGRLIRSVSGAGKTTMYIVPLQQDLDLTPLPSDATEFQKMPKAACQVCKLNMPLHILALHIENCMESAADDDEDWQSEVQVLSVTNSPLVRPNKESRDCGQDRKECPICCGCFPSDEIVLHASLCGERWRMLLCSLLSCVLLNILFLTLTEGAWLSLLLLTVSAPAVLGYLGNHCQGASSEVAVQKKHYAVHRRDLQTVHMSKQESMLEVKDMLKRVDNLLTQARVCAESVYKVLYWESHAVSSVKLQFSVFCFKEKRLVSDLHPVHHAFPFKFIKCCFTDLFFPRNCSNCVLSFCK